MKRLNQFNSLKFRFALLAIIVSTIIFSAAISSFWQLNNVHDQATLNLEHRQKLLETTHAISMQLFDAYKSLNLFLLDPSKQNYRDNLFLNLSTAIELCDVIKKTTSPLDSKEHEDFYAVRKTLLKLQNDVKSLIKVRTDPTRQYPSMAVANDKMQPNRNKANNAFIIIFNELESEKSVQTKPDLYKELVQLRHLWTQTLSNFRLYLANRVGSFNEASLSIQENGIDTLSSELNDKIEKVIALDEKGVLGFETFTALLELRNAVKEWQNGFNEAKLINRSNRWRMDSVVTRSTITPAFENITNSLDEIESKLVVSLEADIQTITGIARQSSWSLLALAAFAIIFVILLVVLTQRFVFRPITTVSLAMKAQALGKLGHELPMAKTKETRQLIDAFNEMHRLINLRQSELEHRAMHDALTSLPNRALLFDHIEHDIQLANRAGQELSLMVIDLDRFKEVNDTLGHNVGDNFLIEVGARFTSELRESDTVARLGGDEFSILIPDMGRTAAKKVAEKILKALKKPIKIGEFELPCSASIGISTYPTDGDNAHALLQHADVAMYIAKRNQSGFEFYDINQDQYSIQRLALVNELRTAIEEDKLELAFQPIVNVSKHSLFCVESLLRWNHPEHGYISPELIIDLAEQTGIITQLTYYVLEKTMQQQNQWATSGMPLTVSVNLSMHNLRDKQLVEKVQNYLAKYMPDNNQLILEITESAMMSNPHQVIDILEKLAAMNVTIAIDDFGTGFSSLAYLKKLPVRIIKIDRSFIIELDNDLNDQAIVHATLGLSHELGLQVIAEGVETLATTKHLEAKGCDAIQGFYISPPMNPDSLQEWVSKTYPA